MQLELRYLHWGLAKQKHSSQILRLVLWCAGVDTVENYFVAVAVVAVTVLHRGHTGSAIAIVPGLSHYAATVISTVALSI